MYDDTGALVGARIGSSSILTGLSGTSPIRFGATHTDTNQHKGPFGRVIWLNRRVTNAEAATLGGMARTIEHVASDSYRALELSMGPVALWGMGETSGTTIGDVVAGRNATLNPGSVVTSVWRPCPATRPRRRSISWPPAPPPCRTRRRRSSWPRSPCPSGSSPTTFLAQASRRRPWSSNPRRRPSRQHLVLPGQAATATCCGCGCARWRAPPSTSARPDETIQEGQATTCASALTARASTSTWTASSSPKHTELTVGLVPQLAAVAIRLGTGF